MLKLSLFPRLGLATALVINAGALAYGQSSGQGVVRGSVTSGTGTPMVNITVVLKNLDNGAKQETTSDASGNYQFNSVPPGRYQLNTAVNGVASAPTGEVGVSSGQATVANLTVSTPSRTVAITSPVTTVQPVTQQAELTGPQIRTAYNTRDVEFVPSTDFLARNGTHFEAYNLSPLSAGVASNGGIGGRGLVVGGQRPVSNNYYIDGVDNTNEMLTGPKVAVSHEATAEFAGYQNQFAPEYGHTTGGQYNAVLRTGSNDFHGAFYEYFQNRNMNAVDQAFANRGITDNPRYDQNRLGASLGFPIIHDKLFFFADFEYIPLGFASTPFSPVFAPTAAGFATLSAMRGISPTNLQFLRSTLPAAGTASSFTTVNGTQIPIGLVSSFGRSYQNQYNGVGALNWKIRQSDNLQLRYVQQEIHANSNGAELPAFFTPQRTRALLASLSEVHNFSGSGSVNELRFGYNRFREATQFGALSFPGLGFTGVPEISIQQDLNLQLGQGLLTPQNAALNTYNLADNFFWRFGRHGIRVGADARRFTGPLDYSQLAAGSFTFSTLAGFLQNSPPDVSGQRTVGVLRYDTNQWDTYGYVKDEWRARANLEIDLGLRYEYASLPSDLRRQSLNAIANTPGLRFGVPGSQRTGFAPTVGLAFAPGMMRNSVFRLGFGMNYDPTAYQALGPLFVPGQTTTFLTAGLPSNFGFFGPTGFFSPNLGLNQTPQALTTSFIADQKLPYTIQWNAGWEGTIMGKFVLSLRYLGVRGVHLPTEGLLNETPVVSSTRNLPLFFTTPSQATLNGLTTTLQSLQPINPLASAGFINPITTITPSGNSLYNGLAVEGRQRFAGGFQLSAAYTWSHLIDDLMPALMSPFPAFGLLEQRTMRGSSVFDHRQRGTLTWLWDVGAIGTTGWYHSVVANMILASTYTYETPAPATLLGGFDNVLTGGFTGGGVVVNPNGVTGVGSAAIPLRNSFGQVVAFQAVNPNAQFIQAGPGVFSNSVRNNFLGLRPINNFDLTLSKRFAVRDRMTIEIRGDAFNLINHPQFTGAEPNNIGLTSVPTAFLMPGAPGFGNVESAFSSHPRILQLALRVAF